MEIETVANHKHQKAKLLFTGLLAGTATALVYMVGNIALAVNNNLGGMSHYYGTISVFVSFLSLIAGISGGGLLLKKFGYRRPFISVIFSTGVTITAAMLLWSSPLSLPLRYIVLASASALQWWYSLILYVPYIILSMVVFLFGTLFVERSKNKWFIYILGVIPYVVMGITPIFIVSSDITRNIQQRSFTVYDLSYLPNNMTLVSREYLQEGVAQAPYLRMIFADGQDDLFIIEYDLTKTSYANTECGPPSLLDDPNLSLGNCELLGVTPSGQEVYVSYVSAAILRPGFDPFKAAYVTIGNTRIIIDPGSNLRDKSVLLSIAGGLKEVPREKMSTYHR